jgi:hypothetical protein
MTAERPRLVVLTSKPAETPRHALHITGPPFKLQDLLLNLSIASCLLLVWGTSSDFAVVWQPH